MIINLFFFIRMNRHLVSLFIKKLFKSLFYFGGRGWGREGVGEGGGRGGRGLGEGGGGGREEG